VTLVRKPFDQYRAFRTHGSQDEPDVIVTEQDKAILRELGTRIAEIGSLPIQQKRKDLWARLNSLQESKPMVWLDDICWSEMKVDHELILQTSSEFCREIEAELRTTLYQWEHMPCDMVVDPIIIAPLAVYDSGTGISVQEDVLQTDVENKVVSHRYHVQIREEEDIEKIQMPEVSHDEKKSEEIYQAYREIFDGILNVEQSGAQSFEFSPVDDVIKWTGIQEGLMDLVLRPEYVHKLVDRLSTAYQHILDQYEALNLLALNNTNIRIGSGAYGYTDDLPQPEYDADHVRPQDMWGFATAQIFSTVSPQMHEEFALRYEARWLERFGLSYYGCCEPLSNKIDILSSIPNLRKISMSAWTDLDAAAEQVKGDYVLSIKPNPAVLATDRWYPDHAREELETQLKIVKEHQCQAEIVMKDISTVRYEPQRLWEWARIAAEVTQRYA